MPRSTSKHRATIGLISLGCAKNEVDAERILGAAVEDGWLVCADPADADVVVVNTCGFIASARAESCDAIEQALALKQAGTCKAVIVSGCLAERYGNELRDELPDVDAWVGIGEPRAVPTVARKLLADHPKAPVVCMPPVPHDFGPEGSRLRITPPHYAYLRIAEGCDNRCAYCAIPLIRGPLRSKPIDTCVAEARDLVAGGCRELILIAQDTTNYGRDACSERDPWRPHSTPSGARRPTPSRAGGAACGGGEPRLPVLLDALAAVEGIRWLRLLYAHPAHFTDATLDAFARHPQLCHYIDLPIQHASDPVLERMGRGTTRAAMADLFARVRDRMPDAVLRTTALVGYPGETEDDFAALIDFVEAVEFDRLGAFAYSEEEGTRALDDGPEVPEHVRAARLDELMRRQQPIAFRKAAARVGTTCDVVLDACLGDGAFAGRSTAEAPDVDGILRVTGPGLRVGEFTRVRIARADGYDLEARSGCEQTTGEDCHGEIA